MKAEFLKMAGFAPGQEDMFYQKYPSEDAFFKAHPHAKTIAKGGTLSIPANNGQATEKQFFDPGWMPNIPDYFYAMGGDIPCVDCGGMMKYPFGGSGPNTNPTGSTAGVGNVYTDKKMNPQQWDQFNQKRGFKPMLQNIGSQGSTNPYNKNTYQSYYDPTKGAPQLTPGSSQYTYAPGQLHDYGYTDPQKSVQHSVQATSNRTAVAFGQFGPGSISYKDNNTGMVTHYDKSGQPIQPQTMQYGGDLDIAKSGWIQKASASIKKRGTEGVCTGSKFGGPGCPPGSKRYNLAKTFRAMAKKAGGGETDDGTSEDEYIQKYTNDFLSGIKDNVWRSLADQAAEEFTPYEDLSEQDHMNYGGYMQMGGAGMNMGTPAGFNPNMNNQQMFGMRANQLSQQGKESFQNFGAATTNLGATANPHMQWSMPKALEGMFMQKGGSNRDFFDYFPMNHDPYMVWKQHGVQAKDPDQQDNKGADPYRFGNFSQQDLHRMGKGEREPQNPGMSPYLQSYEAKKRLFGPGARYVKMTFRSPYDIPGQLPIKDYHDQGNQQQMPNGLSPFPLGFPVGPHAYDVPGKPEEGPAFPGVKEETGPRAKYGMIMKFLPKNQMGGVDQMQMMQPNLTQPMQDMQLQPMQPMQGYKDTTIEGKYKMGLNNEAGANWLMAGLDAGTSILNQQDARNAKKKMKSLQGADANFMTQNAGNRGTYGQTGAYNGVFNPYNMNPVQQPGQNFGQMGSPNQFAYGGGYNFGGNMEYHQVNPYEVGGEYDLDESQIAQILASGGTVEYL